MKINDNGGVWPIIPIGNRRSGGIKSIKEVFMSKNDDKSIVGVGSDNHKKGWFESAFDLGGKAIDKVKSDVAVFALVALSLFVGFTFIVSQGGIKSEILTSGMIVAYLILVSILIPSVRSAYLHAQQYAEELERVKKEYILQVDSMKEKCELQLKKAEEIIEFNSKKLQEFDSHLSMTMQYADILTDGTIDIKDEARLKDFWGKMLIKAKSRICALNYISSDIIISGDYSGLYEMAKFRKQYHQVTVSRLFLVDNEEEAIQIKPLIEQHRANNIDAGFIILKDAKLFIGRFGFNPENWSEGFIVLDNAYVARFVLEDRHPEYGLVIQDPNLVRQYRELYETLFNFKGKL